VAPKKSKAPTKVRGTGIFYSIQLVSISNSQMVEKSWADIYKNNANILSGYQPLVEEVQVKNKTYYRIKTGEFSSKSEASQICKKLKSQSVNFMASLYLGQTLEQFLLSKN
jgi:septal ring-binding cell division protein DamX